MNTFKIRFTLFLFLVLFLSVSAQPQNVTKIMKEYFKEYQRTDIKLKPSKVKSCLTNTKKKRITITVEGGFQEQFFTEPIVEQIYDSVRSILPKKNRDYKITIITDGHPIEELVPNYFRTSKIDESRLWKKEYKGKPWTKNISRLYTADEGLEGTHISLWQKRFGDSVRVINGDKPIMRFFQDRLYAYGTPWCGKEGLSENARAPIKGICFIERAKENSVERISPAEALPRIFQQILTPNTDTAVDALFPLIDRTLLEIPCYVLKCNISEEAAEVAYEGMNK